MKMTPFLWRTIPISQSRMNHTQSATNFSIGFTTRTVPQMNITLTHPDMLREEDVRQIFREEIKKKVIAADTKSLTSRQEA